MDQHNRSTIQRDLYHSDTSPDNGASHLKKREASVEIVRKILFDLKKEDQIVSYVLPITADTSTRLHFENAFNELCKMLDGSIPLDLKRAIFLTENAFFGNSLNYDDFLIEINKMIKQLEQYMSHEQLNPESNEVIQYAVYKYMTDTLRFPAQYQETNIISYPKRYDIHDPFGYENPTNLFVSKLMDMNTGQCKSLPLLYLLLVQELGGQAYLSFSPAHSYIKYQTNKGIWYNIELTNGLLTTDSWVLGSGYVKAEAVKSGIFMDTLNTKQVIANCVTDLAQYYSYRYGAYDKFVLKCANKTLEHHSSNINAMLVKSDYYTYLMQYIAYQTKATSPEQLNRNPEAKKVHNQMVRMYQLLDQLGYENMPLEAYKKWLNTHKEK